MQWPTTYRLILPRPNIHSPPATNQRPLNRTQPRFYIPQIPFSRVPTTLETNRTSISLTTRGSLDSSECVSRSSVRGSEGLIPLRVDECGWLGVDSLGKGGSGVNVENRNR